MTNSRSKVGFAVNNFGVSELAYHFINNANKFVIQNPNIDLVGFYENVSRPCTDNNFPLVSLSYAYRFDGPIVVTSLDIAEKTLGMPYLKERIFYIWDLDWIRPWKKESWKETFYLYNDERLTKIARCKDHKRIIENVCGCYVKDVVEDCNLEKLLKEINLAKKES